MKDEVFVAFALSEEAQFAYDLMVEAVRISESKRTKFPDVERKQPIREELYAANLITRHGNGPKVYYTLNDGRSPAAHEMKQASKKMPISRGKNLPTGQEIIDFAKLLENEERELNKERSHEIKNEIEKIIKSIGSVTGTRERSKMIQELTRLDTELQSANAAIMIRAIQNVSVLQEFRHFEWPEIVSMNPDDYQSAHLEASGRP